MSITSLGESVTAQGRNGGVGSVFATDCPSRAVLQHVTSRWGLLILLLLLKGSRRFSELRHGIDGVSEKMLAQSLRALEADGFVIRTVQEQVPPRVEYGLSAIGVEVALHVEALADWIEANLPRIQQAAPEALDGAADTPGVRLDIVGGESG
ncbi:winged helix-turn-helix transcriptional regulator [Piscinibacter terrae]|uniref:Transcriptional regulator n=1 Tax=Piscinibacter terrae TaxID=2496871 RepID=A0A3N7HKS1_9BURK|nr:helix-turn-helix domain-containing protein [Albitalea terrae]RQP22684.1 transcriptional regulator [Albitalea terrae]